MENVTIKMCGRKGCTEARHVWNTGTLAKYCHPHQIECSRGSYHKNRDKNQEMQKAYRLNNEGHTFKEPEGYIKYVGFNHPACSPSGITRHHRMILWDKLNGQDVPCPDCGVQLFWDKADAPTRRNQLQVDHINGVRDDNRPENLDPICHACNTKRGSAMKAASKEETND